MPDDLRICKIDNMRFPTGILVKYEGDVVGRTISSNEVAINSDVVHRLIRGKEAQFSMEVTRK